ncbi:hypothetical protein MNV49_005911 [Pseudohyphozyma bogoriensis]|nr:hypothetical protein MNV49_005911 [Pseudohyphozyma bogoriensis]
MANFCHACGTSNSLEYDPSAGADVCTSCGTISTDSSSNLVVLGRVLEEEGTEAGRNYLHDGGVGYVGAQPRANGRLLVADEKKSEYHLSRKADVERFIRSLLNHFTLSPLFPRVKALFAQAKDKRRFRWGPKAKLIATACVYLASRERDKSLRLQELANITDIDLKTLTRAQEGVKIWLDLHTTDPEPVVFIEQHIVHLSTLLASSPNPRLSGYSKRTTWTPKTLTYLRSLDFRKVRTLAAGILDLSAGVNLGAGRQAEHVSIAALVVAMEGSTKGTAPKQIEILSELASTLGLTSTYVIAERYREFIRMLEDFAQEVPWVGQQGKELKKKDTLKFVEDVVTHRRMLMAKKMEEKASASKLRLLDDEEMEKKDGLGTSDDDDDEEEDEEGDINDAALDYFPDPLSSSSTPRRSPSTASGTLKPPPPKPQSTKDATTKVKVKRPLEYMRERPGPEKRARTIEQAAGSLLSVLGSHSPSPIDITLSRSTTPELGDPRRKSKTKSPPLAKRLAHDPSVVRYRQQLLAGSSSQDIFEGKAEDAGEVEPSRLALLLWEKDEDEISDSELFGEGELESFVRSPSEVEMLKRSEKFQSIPYKEFVEPDPSKPIRPRTKKLGRLDPAWMREHEAGSGSEKSFGRDEDEKEFGRKKTKVDQAMKDRLARLFAEGADEADGVGGDALNLELGWKAAQDEGEVGWEYNEGEVEEGYESAY